MIRCLTMQSEEVAYSAEAPWARPCSMSAWRRAGWRALFCRADGETATSRCEPGLLLRWMWRSSTRSWRPSRAPGLGGDRRAASGLADGPDRAGVACAQDVSVAGVVPTRAPSRFAVIIFTHLDVHAGVLLVRHERPGLASADIVPGAASGTASATLATEKGEKNTHDVLKDYSLASREGRSKPSTPAASSPCTSSPPTAAAPSIATAPTSPTSATPSAARGGPS